MIKVSVLYPNAAGTRFDINYYCSTHMPLVKKLMGPALKTMAVDEGIGGQPAGSPAPYHAIGHLICNSLEDFQNGFGPHAAAIMADIPNYTNAQPIIQISTIKL
jgi:uncharacterized protein (TIGR02118 family)